MGRRILELVVEASDLEVGGAVETPERAGGELILAGPDGKRATSRVTDDIAGALAASDVLIDFTAPEASEVNARIAAEQGKPCVIGTTGLSEAQRAALSGFAEQTAIVYAPNMSVGVNLLFKLTAEVAAVLGLDYNVEIVETHHNQKKDSPSGTALRLAECAGDALDFDFDADLAHGRQGMVGARPSRQIGVHAVRGGDVVGEHTVSFIGQGERVELSHGAQSRDTFARGALRAARFAAQASSGLYDMQDVLGLR
jgi:4-hydroxy-tetrahydrodipicolinate reductase